MQKMAADRGVVSQVGRGITSGHGETRVYQAVISQNAEPSSTSIADSRQQIAPVRVALLSGMTLGSDAPIGPGVQGRTGHLAYRAYARWAVQYWGRSGPFGALKMHQNALKCLLGR